MQNFLPKMTLLQQKNSQTANFSPCQEVNPTESANQSADQSATQPGRIGLRLPTTMRSANRVNPGIVLLSNPLSTRFISSCQSVNSGWSDLHDKKLSSKKIHIVNKFRISHFSPQRCQKISQGESIGQPVTQPTGWDPR